MLLGLPPLASTLTTANTITNGVDWTNIDPVYGPARGYGVPSRDEHGALLQDATLT